MNTGTVTSAAQLFGSYSFQGMQAVGMQHAERTSPWSHGYEALGSLDLNQDGKVSGSELQGLALWFDANRNAVVDQGELKTVQDLGIVSLFYQEPVAVAGSLDLSLSIGYERDVDGVLLQGKSVDWYGEVFENKQEALQALYGMNTVSMEQRPDESRVAVLSDAQDQPLDEEKAAHETTVSGLWIWQMKEEGGEQHPGLFSFSQTRGNKVSGYSIAEAVLKDNDAYHSMVSMHPASGELLPMSNGSGSIFRFQVTDKKSGVSALSKAELSADGMTMHGSTTQSFLNHDTGDSKRINYTWVAYKLQ